MPRQRGGWGRLSAGVAKFLVSPDWEPLYPMQNYGVYASRWPLGRQTVWTIVNRTGYDVGGKQMNVPAMPGMRYFDLYHGTELKPETDAEIVTLSFAVEANGYGAILATPGEPDEGIKALMRRMTTMTQTPLASFSHAPVILQQAIAPIAATRPATATPEGMVRVPGGSFDFKVQGTEIEGGGNVGVDVQYPWEDSARRFHEHTMDVAPYYIDKYPVTNAEFKNFWMRRTMRPKDANNFLRDWKNGTFPAGLGEPAGYVGFVRGCAGLRGLGRETATA